MKPGWSKFQRKNKIKRKQSNRATLAGVVNRPIRNPSDTINRFTYLPISFKVDRYPSAHVATEVYRYNIHLLLSNKTNFIQFNSCPFKKRGNASISSPKNPPKDFFFFETSSNLQRCNNSPNGKKAQIICT